MIQRICDAVKQKADAMLITSPINIRYVTSFNCSAGFCLVLRDKVYLLLDFRYFESAKTKQKNGFAHKNVDIVLQENSVYEQIKNMLTDCKTVLFEDKTLTYRQYCTLKEKLCDFELVPGSDVIDKLRASKTQYEIENIKKAQSITDKTFEYMLGIISDNVGKSYFTENYAVNMLEQYMKEQGAQTNAFDTIFLTGTKTSLPHGTPENTVVSKGFLTIDFGAKYDGYCSDMTRTLCIGKPDVQMLKVYNTVLEAQNRAFEKICAGVAGKHIDNIARDFIYQNGYKGCFGHSLGHSLGLDIHEWPNFSPSEEGLIPENAVISVEPGIYLEGKYGVRIEDIVRVTDKGFENLTKSKKELIVI